MLTKKIVGGRGKKVRGIYKFINIFSMSLLIINMSLIGVFFVAPTTIKATCTPSSFWSDGFEEGYDNWTSGKPENGKWEIDSSGHTGSAARVKGDNDQSKYLYKSINTTSQTNMTISYWYKTTDFPWYTSNDVSIDWSSDNGSHWTNLFKINEDTETDSWIKKTHDLPAGVNRIRFKADITDANRKVWLDDVVVSGCSIPTCTDNDSDGYGNPASSVCSHPELDCIDSNAAVNPGATEVCDGVDNDCDGQIDESLTPPAADNQNGICSGAVKTCNGVSGWVNDYSSVPSYQAEESNCDNKDNDCDGTVDEGYNVGDSCTNGVGACQVQGTLVCAQNQLGATCNATPGTPTAEVCNGVDDDCDGIVDEGIFDTPTSCGIGECAAKGLLTCAYGSPVDTCKAGTPATEICDNKDNNCNGSIDDDIAPRSTENQNGLCSGNVETCSAGEWRSGTKNYLPVDEVCDSSNLDENCSGESNEGCKCENGDTQACGVSSVGACSMGTQTCADGAWGSCVGSINPTTEVCDGVDNDCDGQIDEGVTTTFYHDADLDGYGNDKDSTEACSAPVGDVDNGRDCDDSDPAIHPGATEICDNQVDEDCDGIAQECLTGSITICKYSDFGTIGQYEQDTDTPLAWNMTITHPDQSTSTTTTSGETGCVTISDLSFGTYSITEADQANWVRSYPESSTQTASINIERQNPEVYFLNQYQESQTGGSWSDWGTCSASCGGGTQTRTCNGGTDCVGESTQSCNTQECSSGGGGGGGYSGGAVILEELMISNETILSSTDTTATFTWLTNHPASSYVLYAAADEAHDYNISDNTGTPALYGYPHATTEDLNKVTFHTVTVTGLTPNTVYHFRPVSHASFAVGKELALTTSPSVGEVLGVKITAPESTPTTVTPAPVTPTTGEVAGIKILPATGFDVNELLMLIFALTSLIVLRATTKRRMAVKI